MAGEKTEKATPKRKQEERKKGNIFQSREVVTVASMVILFTLLRSLLPAIAASLTGAMRRFWGMAATTPALLLENSGQLLVDSLVVLATCILPLALASILVAVVFTFAQTRMLVTAKNMSFKFNRLNPLSGFKRLFSLRGLVEMFKAILKVVVLVLIVYYSLKDKVMLFPRLLDMSPVEAVTFLGDLLSRIVNTAAAVFVFLAVADYVYQWWEYEKNLRMSKQEIKEEYKQTEGDPQVKGKIKEKQRQMAMSRMMQAVPSADVIIRNPTHFAVAIQYDAESGFRAPRVVAKGADLVAQRIIAIAEEAGVTVTENVPLARALYADVELGWEIPEKFYQPVAEVLAFVYSMKQKTPPTPAQRPDGGF